MKPFEYNAPDSLDSACKAVDHQQRMALAGGTTMLDLMKLNVLTPEELVFVAPVLDNSIAASEQEVHIGAGYTMSDVASHNVIADRFPALRQSLILAASPQLRNMATIGGNLLQRTRSAYYRHPDFPDDAEVNNGESNDSKPFGEGADGTHLAVLGNQGRLVGTYPGDLAIAVVAFNGQLELSGPDGKRTVAARDFYRLPEEAFQYEPDLKPGELITRLTLPLNPATKNSQYLKIRDRSSYAFALASAAVGLELDGKGSNATIRSACVGLGGLAPYPWNSAAAVNALEGHPATDDVFQSAADVALADAQPPEGTAYRVDLARRTLVRALRTIRDHGPLSDEQLWAQQHGRGLSLTLSSK